MSFENWNDLESAYESDYEAYFDESYDEDYGLSDSVNDYSEARRRKRKEPRPAKGRPMPKGPTRPYQGQGQVVTPAGTAQVKLPENLVTKAEFLALQEKVLANNKAILANGKAIEAVNANSRRVEEAVVRQGKGLTEAEKKVSTIQQAQMISPFLAPRLKSVDLTNAQGTKTSYTVSNPSSDMLPAMIPMMMGGMSGGNGDNSFMMALPLMLMNQGSSGTNDNSGMMMAIAMMMMNKK